MEDAGGYLVWWLVAGSIVLALLVGIVGLTALGRNRSLAKGLLTGSLGLSVVAFAGMVAYVVLLSGGIADEVATAQTMDTASTAPAGGEPAPEGGPVSQAETPESADADEGDEPNDAGLPQVDDTPAGP